MTPHLRFDHKVVKREQPTVEQRGVRGCALDGALGETYDATVLNGHEAKGFLGNAPVGERIELFHRPDNLRLPLGMLTNQDSQQRTNGREVRLFEGADLHAITP
jgi:hypothetical protein